MPVDLISGRFRPSKGKSAFFRPRFQFLRRKFQFLLGKSTQKAALEIDEIDLTRY
jgi:hypothetical protein